MGCSDCSYLSSGGEFPNGYCVWLLRDIGDHDCLECYCKDGFECEAPPPNRLPQFEGETIRVPCILK